MSDAEELKEQPYGDLMNAARSAREQFDELDDAFDGLGRSLTKDELVEEMTEYGFDGSRADGWTVEVNGSPEEVDLLDVQTPQKEGGPSGPTDSTILYCLTRAETTPQRVSEIREALDEMTDYELREANGGDKYSIVLPAEAQEGYEEPDDEDVEDEDEDSEDAEDEEADEEAESEPESEDEEEADPEPAEEDEADESESEADEEEEAEDEEEDDDDLIPRDAARKRFAEKNKEDLYDMAVEEDIPDRSKMTKEELIDAILDEKDEVADV